jgi:hypothetical protein
MTAEETVERLIPKDIPEHIRKQIIDGTCPVIVVEAIGNRSYQINGGEFECFLMGALAHLRGYPKDAPKPITS